MSFRLARIVASLSLTLCTACGPKLVRETVYQEGNVRVELRRTLEGGRPIPRGYTHPVIIADVRIAHILASLNHEDSKGKRQPTIRSEHVYELAEGMARALRKASPDDEIAAAAFPVDRQFYLFKHERVTSFRSFFNGDELVLEFYAIDESLERTGSRPAENKPNPSDYKIPVDPPDWRPGFTLVAGRAQRLIGARTVMVDWRSSFYARPRSLRLRGGRIQRRTILMEEAAEVGAPEMEAATQVSPPPTAKVSDAQMRALDEIDAARRAGLITESEFLRRRRLVLEDRLEEAGYGTEPGD